MKIPAISGGGATAQFKKVFWDSVIEKNAITGLPIRGSLGVHWNVYKDLRTLAETNLFEQLLLCRVNKSNPRNPCPADPMISKIAAGFLKTFYEFCEQMEQPYFFIKNGASPLYLAEKTSPYLYDPDHEFPHRLSYRIVRVVTETEGRQRLGDGNKAMFLMEPDHLPVHHLETVDEPVAVPMPKAVPVVTTIEKPKRGRKKKEETTATTATVPATATATVPEPKKGRKKKEEATVVTATATATVATVEEKPKRQTKPKATNATKATSAPKQNQVLTSSHMETSDEPLSVDAVELVRLQPFDANGTSCYRDPVKNKLFKQNKDGSIGAYMGRWSTKECAVHEEVLDSDRE
jgi:hypothetical protein